MGKPADIEVLKARVVRAEAALQTCNRLAVASQYAGAMMHEVNNPLAAIANLIFLIKLQANDPQMVIEYSNTIETQLALLSGITGRVLSFHREQASPKNLDLKELIESALRLHQVRIAASNVALIRDFGSPAPASIFEGEIFQVVSNLLLNSLDALPKQGAKLHIRLRRSRELIHITVADNGSGIPPDVMKHLFEPYRTTKSNGTGLGLWLSKLIVDKHKGKLRVRSCQSKNRTGTTFRLSLPTQNAAPR
jgi:signal transduction histidine kinase